MSKIVGFAVAAVTLVMAIACGGSDDASTTYTPYYASIDNALEYATISKATLNPINTDGTTSTATVSSSSIATGNVTNGTDHQVQFFNLSAGNYLMKVIGTNGSDLYQGPVKVTASVNAISGLQKGKPDNFQINALTTYLISRAGGNLSSSNFASVLTTVLGANVSLDSIYMDGPNFRTSTNVIALSDSTASQAVKLVSIVLAAKAKLTGSANLALADNLITSLASATNTTSLDAALVSTSGNLTSVLGALSATDAASVATTIVSSLGSFATTLGISTGSLGTIATLGTTASAVATAETATQTASATVSSFTLADASFGSSTTASSTTNFTLATLAPVFKVQLSDSAVTNQSLLTGSISLSLAKTGGATYTLTESDSTIKIVWASSNLIYITVPKSDSLTIAAKELEPGASYTYTITTTNVPTGFTSTLTNKPSGTITTEKLTVTSPTVPVAISGTSYTGVTAPKYNVNLASGYAFVATSSSNVYGLLDSASVIGTGSKTLVAADLTVTNLTVDGASATSATVGSNITGATVQLANALSAGTYSATYGSGTTPITVTALTTAGTTSTVTPVTLNVTIK